MSNLIQMISGISALMLIGVGGAAAESRLPIADGMYLTAENCDLFKKQELDMVRFTVKNNGNQFSFEEGYCMPATVKQVRENRYHVNADCDEFGELFQQSFFLDVKPNSTIVLDGEELSICVPDKSGEAIIEPATVPVPATKAKRLYSKKEAEALIDQWLNEYEDCQGSGNESACERRNDVIAKLEQGGWCFGKESDKSRSSYDWHLCDKNSIRHMTD